MNDQIDDTKNLNNSESFNLTRTIQTDTEATNGQTKCPKCGSTDILTNQSNGKLICTFCRHQFDPIKVEKNDIDINKLEGEIIGSGSQDIDKKAKDKNIITLKCQSCGAEVVVNTEESTHSRCHWCRNSLSVNQQVPNGSIPDMILPFALKKEEAKRIINNFVGQRKFFAHPIFKKEFTTKNIMGVYFPYMVVDINAHALLSGYGEHQTKSYAIRRGEKSVQYYDADLYKVDREFDIAIDDLTVESKLEVMDKKSKDKTNNIINAIMPFDTENCVQYDSNYTRGFSSEKRNMNIDKLRQLVFNQSKDIAIHSCNDTLTHYDRGVAWEGQEFEIKGQQWKSAYLPVWLYSYQEVKKQNKILHYVAVNARTKEVMGSVPIHIPKLIWFSILVEFFGVCLTIILDFEQDWVFALSGIAFYAFILFKYRNSDARHYHESDTKAEKTNLTKDDSFVEHRTKLTNNKIDGCNNELKKADYLDIIKTNKFFKLLNK